MRRVPALIAVTPFKDKGLKDDSNGPFQRFLTACARISTTYPLRVVALWFVLIAACSSEQRTVEERGNALDKQLICPICPGETIDQAQVQIAKDMRKIVREKLAAGEAEADDGGNVGARERFEYRLATDTIDRLLMRFPRENRTYFLECAANSGMEWRGAQLNGCQFTHGMIHNVVYTGVPLRLLLEEAGVQTNGTWLLAEGADASAMTRSIPMEKCLDDCLVATHMNGERLRPEQGYPLRLVVPGWEGNMWVKWLRRLEVGDQPWHHREETSKYTDLLANGDARRFTWVMDASSPTRRRRPRSCMVPGRPF